MNTKTFIFLLFIPISCLAQQEIYKCTMPDGEIAYLNETQKMKNLTCEKTDLGKIDKLSIINNPNIKKNQPTILKTDDLEQKIRNDKRNIILKQELEQEKTQLTTINNMLKNADKQKDTEQYDKLKKMQENHEHNIESIQKEIGVKDKVELLIINKPQKQNTLKQKAETPPITLPEKNTDEQKKTLPDTFNDFSNKIKNIFSPNKEQ